MKKLSVLALAASGVLMVWPERSAKACGGTFPAEQSEPVDQTGETVLFVADGDTIEAHVQINYDPQTQASGFAWIIPVPAVPEFAVSSQELVLRLALASSPSYGYVTFEGDCGGGYDPCAHSGSGGTTGAGGTTGDPAGEGGPEVVKREVVGAFEVSVLQGGTVDGVVQWLGANGYQADASAGPILQEYADEGNLFVAFKLVPGASLEEVHPIMLRYPGQHPMVPIRLTRVAAAQDMELRVMILSDVEFIPRNYAMVELNLLKLDWLGLAQNYRALVSEAVDDAAVYGRGFVPEYVGPVPALSGGSLRNPSWNADEIAASSPETVVEVLESQGLALCTETFCSLRHPLLEGLLLEYLPPPQGVDRAAYWDCVSCYAGLVDTQAWSADGFAVDLAERIIAPAEHADELLLTWSQLSRYYTALSPEEMTRDPWFSAEPGAKNADHRNTMGTLEEHCDGSRDFLVGTSWVRSIPSQWPAIGGDKMPAARKATLWMEGEAPLVVADHHLLIANLLAGYNGNALARAGQRGHCGGTTGGAGGTSTTGPGGHGWESDGWGASDGSGGCGCTTDETGGAAAWLCVFVFFAGGRRRRSVVN